MMMNAHFQPHASAMWGRPSGETPSDQRTGITFLRADHVDDPARDQHADRVGELEAHDHPRAVQFLAGLVGAEDPVVGQGLLQQTENLAVEVVDGSGGEDQSADGPAATAHFFVH
jgi:hypothetical protein